MKAFRQFVVATTPKEAVSLRKAIGAKSLYIAGGTTVVPRASKNVEVLIDITQLGLSGIDIQAEAVSIGATTRLSELMSPQMRSALPLLYAAMRRCATPAIRNMATLGGSLAGIFLPSDLGVALLALGATLRLVGDEDRVVSIDRLLSDGWLSGYELICTVTTKRLKDTEGASFFKFGRSDIDIALVNVASLIEITDGKRIENLRLAIGQTFSKPVLLEDITVEAKGKDVSLELIERLARSASHSIEPRSDFRASSQYRKHLVEVLVARSLLCAAEKAGFKLENQA